MTDYNESNCRVRVRYGNDWKQPEEMDIGLVRPKYSQTNDAWRPRLDEEVECKARAEENEPYGWWTCKVSAFSGTDSDGEEQYMVSFIGWGDQHNETLGRSFIRQKSRAQVWTTDFIPFHPLNLTRPLRILSDYPFFCCFNGLPNPLCFGVICSLVPFPAVPVVP